LTTGVLSTLVKEKVGVPAKLPPKVVGVVFRLAVVPKVVGAAFSVAVIVAPKVGVVFRLDVVPKVVGAVFWLVIVAPKVVGVVFRLALAAKVVGVVFRLVVVAPKVVGVAFWLVDIVAPKVVGVIFWLVVVPKVVGVGFWLGVIVASKVVGVVFRLVFVAPKIVGVSIEILDDSSGVVPTIVSCFSWGGDFTSIPGEPVGFSDPTPPKLKKDLGSDAASSFFSDNFWKVEKEGVVKRVCTAALVSEAVSAFPDFSSGLSPDFS